MLSVLGQKNTVKYWDKQRLVKNRSVITAIPALLEMLDKTYCIITIDAMGTQKLIAQKIIEAESDYILNLKDNHPTLHQQVKTWFETSLSLGFKGIDVNINQRVEKGHHRVFRLYGDKII